VTSSIRSDFEPVLDILLDNGTVCLVEGGGHYELAQR
jgi:hypothetical protein